MESFERKLSTWKCQYLSFQGSDPPTLINATLPLLVSDMSLFKIPVEVANKLKLIQRNFMGGGDQEKQKMYLMG